MAEDGMLINFNVDQAPFSTKPRFKGGSWKDRFHAKKSASFNHSKANGRVEQKEPPSQEDGTVHAERRSLLRPHKKPRLERPNDGRRADRPRGQAREVVSSLFTYNPESQNANLEEAVQEPSEPQKPSNAPLSSELETFTSIGVSSQLAEYLLRKLEIRAPTAIQYEAVPRLIGNDSDAFIQAETGSGKTLAYLLPIVQRLMSLSSGDAKIDRSSGLFAIVIAPTRELSKQISVVLESLLHAVHWIVSGTVIGGEKKKSEKARLRKGLNILIATPGRLADHLGNTKVLDVSKVRWLVLDEGDRLMELGFEREIEKIIEVLDKQKSTSVKTPGLPEKRTTILCSATMKMNVQKLGEMSLKDAMHIQSSSKSTQEGEQLHDEKRPQRFSAPAQLQQSYAIVPSKLRLVTLAAVLRRAFARVGSVNKVLVFMSCTDSVDFHFELFARLKNRPNDDKVPRESIDHQDSQATEAQTSAISLSLSTEDNAVRVFKLHGNLPQKIRTSTVLDFSRTKEPSVLICTDVASRGLDLPSVDYVIEYDPPFAREDHLHRIGRTARAGKDGRALIFLLPGSEEGYVDILKDERHGVDGKTGLTQHKSNALLEKGFASTGIKGTEGWEDRATAWQLEVERWALENPSHLEQARKAFQSHIRAYATHVSNERKMFDMSQLHLGHLAKAFALRDKPSNIKIPGSRPGKADMKTSVQDRRAKAGKGSDSLIHDLEQGEKSVDVAEAGRKMRSKARSAAGGASEFNLG